MPPTALAEVLFASCLQPSDRPTVVRIREAVRWSLRRHGGSAGCAALVAVEFGEHPDTAVARMRWALTLAAATREAAGETAGDATSETADETPGETALIAA